MHHQASVSVDTEVAKPCHVRSAQGNLPGDTWCIKCQKSGHAAQNCVVGTDKTKTVPSCFKCHQLGHWAFSCPASRGGGNFNSGLPPGSAPQKRKFASFKFYEVLGLEQGASEQDIKRRYRKLAVQHHPDKGGNSEQFIKVHNAYEILGDAEKRSKYDQFGDNGLSAWGGSRAHGNLCFFCNMPGHWARDCPDLRARTRQTSDAGNDGNQRASGSGLCFKCQQPGHWARDCPGLRESASADAPKNNRNPQKDTACNAGATGYNFEGLCFRCNKPGHWARDCPSLQEKAGTNAAGMDANPGKKVLVKCGPLLRVV